MSQKKRTKPVKKTHRAALELHSNPKKTERIVAGARNRYAKYLKAKHDFEEYVYKQVIQGIIEEYNKGIRGDEHIDTIQLFDHTGDWKLNIERRINRNLDGRADMAKNLVEQYLSEVEQGLIEMDPDAEMIYSFLRNMFYKKRGGFKFSSALNEFLLMDENKIHDKRLKKAHKLLKECIHIDRSNWYANVYKYKINNTTGKGEYEKMTINDV